MPLSMLDIEWISLISILLDVVVVSFLIYRVLLMVRGTRAEPMIIGIGIVILVYLASRVFQLATLNWILGNFLGSAILVVVVLFQEDIGRALIKVGLVPGFNTAVPERLEDSLREIARAAQELSNRRIGALIVLRRDVGLEDYLESAVRLDAQISYQLLVSLFLPTSPLHDGAVIVEGDRVLVAGAVLPLSFSRNVNLTLGTRHRAALGLTERSDALVVVVSEETGTITLVREGKLVRDLDETTLTSALFRHTIRREQRRRRGWRNLIPGSTTGVEPRTPVEGGDSGA